MFDVLLIFHCIYHLCVIIIMLVFPFRFPPVTSVVPSLSAYSFVFLPCKLIFFSKLFFLELPRRWSAAMFRSIRRGRIIKGKETHLSQIVWALVANHKTEDVSPLFSSSLSGFSGERERQRERKKERKSRVSLRGPGFVAPSQCRATPPFAPTIAIINLPLRNNVN
jgi:hypothetical protein